MIEGNINFSSRNFGYGYSLNFTADGYNVGCIQTVHQNGYYCNNCGEFTVTFKVKKNAAFEEGFDSDFDEDVDCLAQKVCPDCAASIDIDYPKCPECGYYFND